MILKPWPVNFTRRFCSSISPAKSLVDIVASGVGSLQDMESNLDNLKITLTPLLVTHVIDSSRNYDITTSRRLLRFLSWSRRNIRSGELGDDIYNRAICAFSSMKDSTAMRIALSDLQKEGRKIDPETFVTVSETYVKLGRPEEAVRLFRDIEEKNLIKWRDGNIGEWSSVTAIVQALCAKGHARKAEGVLWHHKGKAEPDQYCHRSLILHGWSVYGNAKEARRVIEDMKASGNSLSLISYHDLLRCICKRNLRFNPSALVPEAVNLMAEMRNSGVLPTNVTFNILLSCLGRARRVREACRIVLSMMRGEEGEVAAPDSVTYYLVIRLLYLTKRFGRGNKILDQMIEEEGKGRLVPKADDRFYHSLIGVLIGVENVDGALELFERMKRSCCCGNETYGPTYDLLIEKLCRSGKFDLGRSLWDEAVQKGITLQGSSDLLDSVKAPQVFNPMVKPPVDKMSLGKVCKRVVLGKKKKATTVVSRTKVRVGHTE